ncbi:MAG: sporulation related domain protein [Rhizobium sp.]|nr:sporulation related domain protein [Rhizobium sp.]
MADKQLLLKQNAEDGFFADDDPLAELARIASFDPQGETRPKPVNARREPEFDLEDELLKGFEQYETPSVPERVFETRPEETPSVEEPVLADDPAFIEDELVAVPDVEIHPATEPEPVRDYPELRAVPVPEFGAQVQPVRPVSHPVFDLEDEILREFAAFDARRAVEPVRAAPLAAENFAAQPVPAVEPEVAAYVQPAVQVPDDVPSRVEPDFDSVEQSVEPHNGRSGYGDDDLSVKADALPESVSFEAPALDAPALDAMEAEVDPVLWHETKQQIFEEEEAYVVQAADEPFQAEVEEPIHLDADSAPEQTWVSKQEWVSEQDLGDEVPGQFDTTADETVSVEELQQEAFNPQAEIEPETPVVTDVAEPLAAVAEAPVVAREVPVVAKHDDFGLDELLADVERYPVNTTAARWQQAPAAMPAAQPAKEQLPPAVEIPVLDADPAVAAAELVDASKSEPEIASVETLPVPEVHDDGAFELDLTEIELDMLEMEVENSVAPPAHEDQIVASPAALAEVAEVTVPERPAYLPERAFVAVPRPAEDYSSLPFDPSQISGDDDPVEALAEMDVPEMPVVDHGVSAPTQPDYDIDIDAEMAHIFSRPAEPGMRPTGPKSTSANQAALPDVAAVPSADLDEFERALEEDFRRSLSENRATSTPDRVALTPAAYDGGKREGSTSRRLMVLAASVAGVMLIGGAGVYAYIGDGSKLMTTSSEPKIILADKDPVKVLPKDRGGQTVPNQDKAVYDRVSGDDKDAAKQERLVTSNEEPVDVVQKTLMPENLPMDNEEQVNTTDTSDTSDPRLLPDGQDKNITATEKVVSGVSPRKVRTMVVRSDGTLVARDEPVVDETKDVTPAEASQERSLDIAPSAEVPDRLTANDETGKLVQEANADTKAFVPPVEKPADVVESTPAVTDEQPAVKTEDKPVVVEETAVKPVEAAPVEQEEKVADAPVSQTEDTQAAINDAANAEVDEIAPIHTVKTTKISANTPIPENRPVDQPVDIVGTVTDQGNVRDTQEVANADPVKQPVENAQTTTTPAGAYVIQIASLPSEAEAKSSYTKLSAKFASVIGGRSVDIRKAAIKNKGTYYRVRIPVGTRQEATELCSRYKQAGGSCLVSK